jgi:hypothetical protein
MRRLARFLVLLLPYAWASCAAAQTSTVDPSDATLSVEVLEQAHTPFPSEMVTLLIRGEYRRHITREALEQPDLEGFNWTQLGPDRWTEERIDGKLVKVMQRRMALYPERAGTLTIGAFTHHLTLTDEGDDWFSHDIRSSPVTVQVAPGPELPDGAWWFPAKRIEISDTWSNPPDQLQPGEGVLRIIRIKAIGATPEMIPPMPELGSPSGMVFAHPEKRLIELSPEGPVSYAFWRWTIQPGNDRSAIVEPLRLSYFDTEARVLRDVTISAQRVAYDAATLPAPPLTRAASAVLPGWPAALAGATALALGLAHALSGWRPSVDAVRRRLPMLDPLARKLRQSARAGHAAGTRRAAAALLRRDGAGSDRQRLLAGLDRALFARAAQKPDLPGFARAFLQAAPDTKR